MKNVKFQVFEWLDTTNPDSFVGFGVRVRLHGTWMNVKDGDRYIWETRSEANSVGKKLIFNLSLGLELD